MTEAGGHGTRLFDGVEAIVFDILGTLVDQPGGIRRGLERWLPAGDTVGATEGWLDHVDREQQAILAARWPYVDNTALDTEAATRAAADVGITDADVIAALVLSAQRLDPWPDSVRALDRIASRLPVVGLSNASRPALTRINAHAGLRWHQALSAADAATYKPHADVYRLAVHATGCAPDRLLMVAAHAWDLRGAQAIGMKTAYVDRPGADPPRPTDAFDLTATSLDDLAAQLTS